MVKTVQSPKIAASLQPFVDRHVLAGAVVLVASKTEVLSLDAVGQADLAAGLPMRTDCLFWIASTSKPMTATALMMLVDEGKVNVEEPVERYLPEFKGQMLAVEHDEDHTILKKPARPITVRDILSHTSGLPFMSRVEQVIDARPLREAVVSYALTPLKSEPGAKYEYSNAGINTAGRIIEVISGLRYEQFMQQRLFTPLGMKDTTFFRGQQQVARLAKCYKPNAAKTGLEETTIDQLTYPLSAPGRHPCPAGGLFSTAADVARFGQMILNGGQLDGRRYLCEAAVRQMTSTQTGPLLSQDGNEAGYGFGWSTSRKDPGTGAAPAGACGHGGACGNQFSIDPQQQRVLIFMVQHGGYPGDGDEAYPTFQKAAAQSFARSPC